MKMSSNLKEQVLFKFKLDILVAGGQDHLKGKIFRVGHLGYVNERNIITIISAISNVVTNHN